MSSIDFCILNRSITSHTQKSLRKSWNTQQQKITSLTRNSNLPKFLTNKTISNIFICIYIGLYFSIQPINFLKVRYFDTFEKIHRSFISSFKSKKTKSSVKAHLYCLANSYLYNSLPQVRGQHCMLWNLRRNTDIVISKPDKGNSVVIINGRLEWCWGWFLHVVIQSQKLKLHSIISRISWGIKWICCI